MGDAARPLTRTAAADPSLCCIPLPVCLYRTHRGQVFGDIEDTPAFGFPCNRVCGCGACGVVGNAFRLFASPQNRPALSTTPQARAGALYGCPRCLRTCLLYVPGPYTVEEGWIALLHMQPRNFLLSHRER